MIELNFDEFKSNLWLKNPHLQTIIPNLFRKVSTVNYTRQRLELADGDFVDLDWAKSNRKKLCVLLHGLESSSSRSYIYGAIHALSSTHDCVVLNNRGCSGENNRLFKAYHSGKTEDLHELLTYLVAEHNYENISIVAYSLGGNIALKYAGEQAGDLFSKVDKVVGISVPCDLASSSKKLEHKSNFIYHDRFLKSLKNKLKSKKQQFSELIDLEFLEEIKTIKTFDEYYTAPVNGFSSADDYYEKASSKPFLKYIKIPALIITALDDPFLTEECMPFKEAEENPNISFLSPKKGGHVGFCQSVNQKEYWHETQIKKFLNV